MTNEDKIPRTEKTEESFLNELKFSFQKIMDLNKIIDDKSHNMITVSASIATLNIAIGTFLISRIQNHDCYYYIAIGILSVGIIFSIISMKKFVNSYGIRDYLIPFSHGYFYEKEIYRKDRVDKVRKLEFNDFNNRVFKGYLDSIKKSSEINANKTKKTREGQKWIIYAILSVVIQIGFILVSSGAGIIRLG